MGLVNGMTYCVLLCWALRFMGLFIGLRHPRQHPARQALHLKLGLVTAGLGI